MRNEKVSGLQPGYSTNQPYKFHRRLINKKGLVHKPFFMHQFFPVFTKYQDKNP
jgi:hypothetical protein